VTALFRVDDLVSADDAASGYHVTPHRTPNTSLCLAEGSPAPPCPATPYPALLNQALPCRAEGSRASPGRAQPGPAPPCRAVPGPGEPSHVRPRRAGPSRARPSPAWPCPAEPMTCDAEPHHVAAPGPEPGARVATRQSVSLDSRRIISDRSTLE
jgi:hypothetical protein